MNSLKDFFISKRRKELMRLKQELAMMTKKRDFWQREAKIARQQYDELVVACNHCTKVNVEE